MEDHSWEIIDTVKQEQEVQFTLSLPQHLKSDAINSIPFDQLTLKHIVDNIRPEPEVDFTSTLLQYLKSDGDDSISLEQFTSEEIITNIKLEPEEHVTLISSQNLKSEVENIESHVHLTTNQIIDNIKHEPEENFTLTLPEDSEPENEELKEVKVVLKKSKPQKCKKCGLIIKLKQVRNCSFCDFKFECTKCKKTHIEKDHRKGSTWCCITCDFTTQNIRCLRKHNKSHKKQFSCETCNKKFTCKNQLRPHQQQHRHGVFRTLPEVKFECKKCDSSFATKEGLRKHENHVHSKKKFYCDICCQSFKTKFILRQHMQTHFKVPCPICQHMVTNRILKKHIKEHSSTAEFECDACEKVFFSQSDLSIHKKRKHYNNQVQCDLCSKIFKNLYLMSNHIRIHLKFPCPYCKKAMVKFGLKRHIKKIHPSGEKFLTCDIAKCQQKFRNIKELKDHKKIHIRPGLYKCTKCDHQSTKIILMKKHMETHDHLRKYQIINNIKQEPKVNFTLPFPEESNSEMDKAKEVDFRWTLPEQNIEHQKIVKEVKVVLRKFDRNWKNNSKVLENYFVCGNCDFASKGTKEIDEHSKRCKNNIVEKEIL